MPDEPLTRLDHYRLLGRSGLRVSPICLGTMGFGEEWGWGAGRETCRRIFETYAERGGNFIDTADYYTEGTSERLVGELVGRDRERFVLATKYSLKRRDGDPNAAGNHRKNMMRAVEASLRRLATDYIDLYWLHAWDFTTPVDEVMRGLDDLVRAGKVLYVAVSDTPAWKVAEAQTLAETRGWSRFIGLQVPYNLVRRGVERELLPMACDLGIGVLPWSPLGGGALTGRYSRDDVERMKELAASGDGSRSGQRQVKLDETTFQVLDVLRDLSAETGRSCAQLAVNWLLTRPGVTSVLLGATRAGQMADNLGALDFTLSEEQRERLDAAAPSRPGFPLDFLRSGKIRELLTAGTRIDHPRDLPGGRPS